MRRVGRVRPGPPNTDRAIAPVRPDDEAMNNFPVAVLSLAGFDPALDLLVPGRTRPTAQRSRSDPPALPSLGCGYYFPQLQDFRASNKDVKDRKGSTNEPEPQLGE
jgi:hypothetical protein